MKKYSILKRFKRERVKAGEGYPWGVFYFSDSNYQESKESLEELISKGYLEFSDTGNFVKLTKRGKYFIDAEI